VIRRTLFWQFFGAHILLLIASVGFVTFYMWQSGRTTYRRQWLRELEVQARLAAALLPDGDVVEVGAAAEHFFERLGAADAHRFTLILPDGRVIGDTGTKAGRMESHSDRPEVVEAIAKGRGTSQRYSYSLGQSMLYLALRIPEQGALRAVIRVAVPAQIITRETRAARRVMGGLVAVVLATALVLSYGSARRVIRPVANLRRGLIRIGRGELDYRLPVPSVPHLADLTRAINRTADRLQKHINALNHERSLRTLILANMTHGVIAIDPGHAVLDMNESARCLLGLKHVAAAGTLISDVLREPVLLSLIDDSEHSEGPVERELTVANGVGGGRRLNMRATALNDADGRRVGTLLVLSDVTLLRHLETVRQDFVANVSHELRTPVTSIKGFAEALLDGALDDPEKAERFVQIIMRQSNHLESIIRDLLELSRLDERAGQSLDQRETPLSEIVQHAVELQQALADERGVTLAVTCGAELTVRVHAGLVEQALVNLIDNAIKYGVNGGVNRVEIEAAQEGPTVRITVRDHGQGIEPQHIGRLFERFYRVDKGRSREQGGTGLGLAIVKHIAQLHGGTVTVTSEPGKGTVFTLRLPV
jgi:two-component system phosphate regulon sensor histidine kinase PhoR